MIATLTKCNFCWKTFILFVWYYLSILAMLSVVVWQINLNIRVKTHVCGDRVTVMQFRHQGKT